MGHWSWTCCCRRASRKASGGTSGSETPRRRDRRRRRAGRLAQGQHGAGRRQLAAASELKLAARQAIKRVLKLFGDRHRYGTP